MPYCFMNCRPLSDGQGVEPDCPAGVKSVLLADLPDLGWGIFDVEGSDSWSPDQPVSDKLAALIESGKRYPPALGLAREELGDVFGDQRPSQTELASAYETGLRNHLAQQHEARCTLAQASKDEAGYLKAGEWYWVLEIAGSPAVASFVSSDFQIYDIDMTCFDFTGEQMKRLGYAG